MLIAATAITLVVMTEPILQSTKIHLICTAEVGQTMTGDTFA